MAHHPAISINTLCFTPAPLGQLVDAVVRTGAGAISPDIALVRECSVATTARMLRDAGLAVATLTHRAFGFATPDQTAAAKASLSQTIAIAAEIGAGTITLTSGGRGALTWHDAAQAFGAAMAPCADLALQAGIKLSLEPTSHLYADASIAHRLTDTIALADIAGIHVGIDLFACWTDSDIDKAIVACAHRTALVQVSDYVPGDRGLPCRALPGDGMVPLHRLIPLIHAQGFAGYYDIEVIGPRLWTAPDGEVAALTRAATRVGALLDAAN